MVSKIKIRYLVDDVDKAVEFYTSNLDFRLEKQFGPAIAILEQDGVELLVSGPKASASIQCLMELNPHQEVGIDSK